eukprot:10447454-Alexandrium_andersonii.AAC.1
MTQPQYGMMDCIIEFEDAPQSELGLAAFQPLAPAFQPFPAADGSHARGKAVSYTHLRAHETSAHQ